ncbi:MAG: hypothetical protein PUC66_06855 [Erysipelotrichaceae bacterium]|nr:hypothetical protein [Erysipelotrichaceae bacterium]
MNRFLFEQDVINAFLTGMAFTAVVTNLVPESKEKEIEKRYQPILSLSLLLVIVSLGMPLNIKAIAGVGYLRWRISFRVP